MHDDIENRSIDLLVTTISNNSIQSYFISFNNYFETRNQETFRNFSNCGSRVPSKTYQTGRFGKYPSWIIYFHFGLKVHTRLDKIEYVQQDQSCQISNAIDPMP